VIGLILCRGLLDCIADLQIGQGHPCFFAFSDVSEFC